VPNTLNCACGKTLRPTDAQVGKRVKCSGCGNVLLVPKPEEPEEFDDFEVIEDEPTPPATKAPTKAVAVEETDAEPKAAPESAKPARALGKKKKKKRKKKRAEGDDEDSYEQALEQQKRLARAARGVAYLVVGILMVVGVAYIYFAHWEDVKYTGAEAVIGIICFGVFGVAAIVKGLIGLALGQFFGDDD
jgi:hypothetical protein